MKTETFSSGAAIWERVVQLAGHLPPTAARALLKLRFSGPDHARMEFLSTKARAGTLTSAEQVELDTFERLGCLLDIVHANAQQALQKKSKRA